MNRLCSLLLLGEKSRERRRMVKRTLKPHLFDESLHANSAMLITISNCADIPLSECEIPSNLLDLIQRREALFPGFGRARGVGPGF